MRIAVVRNLSAAGVMNPLGQPASRGETESTAQWVAAALREDGHRVLICEGDMHMLATLARFMPSAGDGSVTGMVFNLAVGIQGEAAGGHVPAMLEMAGVPFTGPGPLGHALAFDTHACRALLRQSGIPTPRHRVLRWPGDDASDLTFPVRVAPRYATGSTVARTAMSARGLGDAVEAILADGEPEAFVEEHLDGTTIAASFIGNDEDLELLSLADQASDGDAAGVPGITRAVALHSGAIAAAAFRACHCKDYGRVVVRIDGMGRPFVQRIDVLPSLERDSSFVRAAVAGGYGPTALAARILDAAHRRYFGVPAPRFNLPGADARPAGVVTAASRRR